MTASVVIKLETALWIGEIYGGRNDLKGAAAVLALVSLNIPQKSFLVVYSPKAEKEQTATPTRRTGPERLKIPEYTERNLG